MLIFLHAMSSNRTHRPSASFLFAWNVQHHCNLTHIHAVQAMFDHSLQTRVTISRVLSELLFPFRAHHDLPRTPSNAHVVYSLVTDITHNKHLIPHSRWLFHIGLVYLRSKISVNLCTSFQALNAHRIGRAKRELKSPTKREYAIGTDYWAYYSLPEWNRKSRSYITSIRWTRVP